MEYNYWEERIETMDRAELEKLQLKRLKKTIEIANRAPYYKEVFEKNGITIDRINSLEDIKKIPFTVKADMREHYPFGLVAGDVRNDGLLAHSAGTRAGNPPVVFHSHHHWG